MSLNILVAWLIRTLKVNEASPRDPNFASKTWIAEIPPRKAIITLGTNLPQWSMSIGWQGEFFRRQDRSPIDNDPEAGYWSLPKSSGYSLHHLFAIWEPKKIHGMKLSKHRQSL